MKSNGKPNWTPADSAELYGIRSWGAGYFDLDDDGSVTVSVTLEGKRVSVSIPDIIAGMQQRGLQIVGGIERDPAKVGHDMGELLGLGQPLGARDIQEG